MITTKGFTLIELLIVIGILAILATTVVLVLNPAALLQETRDTQRLNDLDTLRSAIGLWLATANAPTFTTVWNCTLSPAAAPCALATANAVRAIDGTGWVNINFNNISGGSPIPLLPIDPVGTTQTAALHYSFEADATARTFELTAQMESVKFSNPTTGNKESNDGGNNNDCYEVGTSLTLVLATEC